jgi:hypothetical protein
MVARVLKWNWKMAYKCHCWVLVVLSFFVDALMKHVLIVKIFLVAQYFWFNYFSVCVCVCTRTCTAISTGHSIIVIAKCWTILYWSKNQLQTLCYENFLMLCLMPPHSEAVGYHTAWCYSMLRDILQHYVEVYCLIQYLNHSFVFQQVQTQEGDIRNKT